jgi:hypothetical protein
MFAGLRKGLGLGLGPNKGSQSSNPSTIPQPVLIVKTPEEIQAEKEEAERRAKEERYKKEEEQRRAEEEERKAEEERRKIKEAKKLKADTLQLASATLAKLNAIIDNNFSKILYDSMYAVYNTMKTEQLTPALNNLFSETKISLKSLNNEYSLDFLNSTDAIRKLDFFHENLQKQIALKLNEVKDEYKKVMSEVLYDRIQALANQLQTERYVDRPLSDEEKLKYAIGRSMGGNLSRLSKKQRKPRKKRRVTKKKNKKLN